jgi:hypothetical protein
VRHRCGLNGSLGGADVDPIVVEAVAERAHGWRQNDIARVRV